jgi:predicted transcriptional regulator
LAILEKIIEKNSCICNELVEELPLSQSTISQHLKELKDAGIIKGEIEGQKICYCIDEQKWKEMELDIQVFFSSFNISKNCC